MDDPKGFLSTAAKVAALALLMPLVNLIVDPYWRFNLVTIQGLNAQRPQFSNEPRLGKTGIVCRLKPRSVILGTSRAELGLNPDHPALAPYRPTYNLALAGSGISELERTFRHAVFASPDLHLALVGLDFLMFNANREAVVIGSEVINFDEKRLLTSSDDSCWRTFFHDIDSLLGVKGLVASYRTVTGQLTEADFRDAYKHDQVLALFNGNGLRDRTEGFTRLVEIGGYRRLFGAEQETYYTSKVWRPPPDQRYCFERAGQESPFDALARILRLARASHIDARLFINPIHARLLLALREAGLWPQYEEWKRRLVEVVAAEARESGKPPFVLWDFSGFNSVTVERVPPLDDKVTMVRGFWEPSHYKKETGDLMLDRMFSEAASNPAVPTDFGVRLDATSVEGILKSTRDGALRYVEAEPVDVKLVYDAVDKALEESEGSNCGYDVAEIVEGYKAFKAGDRASADVHLRRAQEIHQRDRATFASLGVPYREPSIDQMIADVRSGKDINVRLGSWEDYQARGNTRLAAGDLSGAEEDFGRAIRKGPPNTALHFLRGTTRLRLGLKDKAAQDFERGLALDPQNATLKSLLAQARGTDTASPSPAPALSGAEKAAALQHEAEVKRGQGDLTGAIAAYGEAINVGPPNTALHYLRGTALLETGNASAATKDFEAGLKLDPDNETLKFLLAKAKTPAPQIAAPSPAPAAPDAERAALLQKQADTKRAAGDLKGAIADYGEAIRVGPKNTALHFLRGTALLQIGEKAHAADDFEAGLALDPENATLKQLLAQAQAP